MAKSTKYLIAEQVILKLEGGYADIASAVQREDIYKRIEQKINQKFKVEHFSVTLPSGETIPDNLSIATYEGVTVTSLNNGKSKSTLPVTPVSLPKNVGIYQVFNPAYPDFPFIPIQKGQRALLRTDALLSDMIEQVTYEPNNTTVTFSKDLTLMDCPEVTMDLVVFDISLYSETEYLPIPSDYESALVEELYNEYAGIVPESGMVNQFTTATNNNQPKQ